MDSRTVFEEHECEMSADALFEKWKLTQYTQSFIEEKGFDAPEIWVDITLDALIADYGFKEGHAQKFIKFVQTLEERRPEFEKTKQKRKKFKKKTNERKEEEHQPGKQAIEMDVDTSGEPGNNAHMNEIVMDDAREDSSGFSDNFELMFVQAAGEESVSKSDQN
eukprot:616025_1